MTDKEIIELFKLARTGDIRANCKLGENYYFGKDIFPKDNLLAKKHFLLAAISEFDIDSTTVHGQNWVKLLELKQKKPLATYVQAAQERMDHPYSREYLLDELKKIETEHGKWSELEIKFNIPKSLKEIALDYIRQNKTLFNENHKRVLPKELEDELNNNTEFNNNNKKFRS